MTWNYIHMYTGCPKINCIYPRLQASIRLELRLDMSPSPAAMLLVAQVEKNEPGDNILSNICLFGREC